MTLELKVAALVEHAGFQAVATAPASMAIAPLMALAAQARRNAAIKYARQPALAAGDFYRLCRELGLPEQ